MEQRPSRRHQTGWDAWGKAACVPAMTWGAGMARMPLQANTSSGPGAAGAFKEDNFQQTTSTLFTRAPSSDVRVLSHIIETAPAPSSSMR